MQDINPFEQCCIDDNLGPLIEHIVQYKISIDKICDINIYAGLNYNSEFSFRLSNEELSGKSQNLQDCLP